MPDIIVKMNNRTFTGIVENGGKSSTKWMPQYIEWLYPGTLNIRLSEPMPEIKWFEEIETHFGQPCRIAKCKINNIDAFLINPPEVSIAYPQYLAEIGHELKLRDLLNIEDGQEVEIIFDEK
jgi:CTP-dependent riboflavin kinase